MGFRSLSPVSVGHSSLLFSPGFVSGQRWSRLCLLDRGTNHVSTHWINSVTTVTSQSARPRNIFRKHQPNTNQQRESIFDHIVPAWKMNAINAFFASMTTTLYTINNYKSNVFANHNSLYKIKAILDSPCFHICGRVYQVCVPIPLYMPIHCILTWAIRDTVYWTNISTQIFNLTFYQILGSRK